MIKFTKVHKIYIFVFVVVVVVLLLLLLLLREYTESNVYLIEYVIISTITIDIVDMILILIDDYLIQFTNEFIIII